MRMFPAAVLGLALMAAAPVARAQQAPPAYGAPVALTDTRKVVGTALADAQRLNLPMAVAVVDWTGSLAAFARSDNTQTTSIAMVKARSVAAFRRPGKAFKEALGGGRMAILALEGAVPVEGGILILREGRMVGAVGVSGGTAQQDGRVAAVGLAALN